MNKNKLIMMTSIVVTITILLIGGIMFNQIEKNHQANKLIIEKCFTHFDNEGTVVIEKKSFWSPVTCEKK
ncbi:hypothetical protein [Metabacillus niabensis]|uniref:hypothetical protein n=1 Tax=Metabacillus niabensis TaxID=324854 RepID=UPI0039A310B3